MRGNKCYLLSNLKHNISKDIRILYLEFDPGSGRTLAACFKHASRTEIFESLLLEILVADW